MEYRELLVDFARRTLRNLEHIRAIEHTQRATGVPLDFLSAYSVTQQVNSMLGLIVFPKEDYAKQLPPRTLKELVAEGWPEPQVTHPNPTCSAAKKAVGQRVCCNDPGCTCAEHMLTDQQMARCQKNHRECLTLAQLLRVLRNGVSHFNIEFHANADTREIDTIDFSNRCNCCDQITTTVRLTVDDARRLVEKFAQLIIDHEAGKGATS